MTWSEQALEEKLAEEAELMQTLIDCIGYLLKAEREAFLPLLDELVMPLLKLLLGDNCSNPPCLLTNAVCLVDDALEVRERATNTLVGAY
jgi:hypothetical protein